MNNSAIKSSAGHSSQVLTNPKILIISFIAWTLTNMDQAFFGYAIPGILEEFGLPLEAVGVMLTISFVISTVMLLFAGQAADRFGRGPMLSLYLAISALLVGLQGIAGGIVMLTLFRLPFRVVSCFHVCRSIACQPRLANHVLCGVFGCSRGRHILLAAEGCS